MYEQKCPNCGGNKIVFENGHFRCTYCDTVFSDKTADKTAFKYEMRVSQATEHLKVGNLKRAHEISKALSDIHPTDPRPYAIMLLSITSKLSIYKLSDDKRNEAANIWNKLEQLNAVNQPMAMYAQNMLHKKMNVVKESIIRDICFIVLGFIMFIAASIKYPGLSQLFIILDILYTCYYCWICQLSSTISVYQVERMQPGQVHNPFLSPLYDSFLNTINDNF